MYEIESRLINSNNILDDVFDFTIALNIGNNTYKLYEKSVETEQHLKLYNVWKNGHILLAKSIFPEAKLQNFF